ncbi:MAG: DUF1549 domain-containing protein, partial [Pirellulaceae bacterium]
MFRVTCYLTTVIFFLGPRSGQAEPVDFSRDVRPILVSKCFACHGPDDEAREAELRLDTLSGATAVHDGRQAVKPGKPAASELIRRITSQDPEVRMPPPVEGKRLAAEQIELLSRWIKEGADFQTHWAFLPPQRADLPVVTEDAAWPQNPIDHFILARMKQNGLQPAARADRYTLVRRLYLDLIGLPPTVSEADAFVYDRNPEAYSNLVDRLLNSEHYGERWARRWLDLARYSDTNGYEKDRPRSIWPYRDWVIKALNDDMPFSQFSIEQLAGDMLPQATESQRVATGFHRNTMINEEGGIDPLEYRFYAMVDRVATTGLVWMGLTVGCAQCHSHKYDPISHSDYYRFMALMDNAEEPDLNVKPADIQARRRQLELQIEKLEAGLAEQFPQRSGDDPTPENRRSHLEEKFVAWLTRVQQEAVAWSVMRPVELKTNSPKLEVLEDGSIFSRGDVTKRDVFKLRFDLDDRFKEPVTALRLEVMPDDRLPAGGPGRAFYEGRKGDFFLSELQAQLKGKPLAFSAGSRSYGKLSVGSGNTDAKNVFDGDGSTGWSTSERPGQPHQLVLNFAQPTVLQGKFEVEMLFERHFVASLGRFRLSAAFQDGVKASAQPVAIERLLAVAEENWTVGERAQVKKYYLSVASELAAARKPIDQLRNKVP